METVRIGTRGSALALAQAHLTQDLIQREFPQLKAEICVIKTSGDKDHVRSLVSFGGQGVFVKEIEEALLENRIDIAVHSLKDVPDSMDARLELSGFLKRENPRDVLVSNGVRFDDLKPNAKIGTGSPRRVLQLKKMRPDVHCVNLRGNLPSRIEKVKTGELDAILLGAAGLNRLGLAKSISEIFAVENVTPAIGQGIIAIQSCVNNLRAKEIAKKISDETTVIAARAERLWMNLLGGGCRVPMGAILEPQNKNFLFTAYLSDPANGNFLRLAQKFSAEDLAENICEKSLKNFAEKFIAECRKKNIRLPSDVAGTEAIAAFWNAEH
ncbi:MAG: hydroxymethylbilane synthase [Hallerella porci]|uniref:Hydroxymethylbilane synthase n=1 Tax=Hallerella porci TaxID=1945871 RepID=A0ABX5LLI9_9BACT|nr:hydroxymethylbilane synthase [Hallerella porci]MDY3921494.1 hydroxymethylbilane synthase [Hallerella porci]PWK98215.1 hydroxymethylbilane synthase [Hallerella porci]